MEIIGQGVIARLEQLKIEYIMLYLGDKFEVVFIRKKDLPTESRGDWGWFITKEIKPATRPIIKAHIRDGVLDVWSRPGEVLIKDYTCLSEWAKSYWKVTQDEDIAHLAVELAWLNNLNLADLMYYFEGVSKNEI
jgi:hypothetical protein